MAATKPAPKAGDKCPNCDGDFAHRAPATDAQRAAAKDRDNPIPLPPFTDGADPTQIGELGELYECRGCGYRTRIKPAPKAAEGDGAQAGAARGGAGTSTAPTTGDHAAAE